MSASHWEGLRAVRGTDISYPERSWCLSHGQKPGTAETMPELRGAEFTWGRYLCSLHNPKIGVKNLLELKLCPNYQQTA